MYLHTDNFAQKQLTRKFLAPKLKPQNCITLISKKNYKKLAQKKRTIFGKRLYLCHKLKI